METKVKSDTQLKNCIFKKPGPDLLHHPVVNSVLPFSFRQALSSRRTGSVAGLETLYTADRIILFFQLVLRCQCDTHVCMKVFQHTGLLSKQTAWQIFGGAIHWLCQKRPKYMASALFWALFRIRTEDWLFQEVVQLASPSVRGTSMCDHLHQSLTKAFHVWFHVIVKMWM